MAKYEWSEVFMSIEGEARYSGHPTVYVRFARCNFACKGFNNPEKLYDGDYATLGWKPSDYKTLQSLPIITRGCDSQYSVNPKFSHMWAKGDEKQLAAEVLNVLPHNSFVNPVTGKRVILSLTGGEPTIRLKFWIPLLEELYNSGMRTILVETNCAAPMRFTDMENFYKWVSEKNETNGQEPIKVVWSNSPKIRMSGEEWDKAIRPEIAALQLSWDLTSEPRQVTKTFPKQDVEQYFKFVCGPTREDFDEVKKAMEEYHTKGLVPRDVDVYIMPVACIEEQQQEIAAKVAKMCMDEGYIYCHRIQNSVFGNGVGT